MTLALYRPRFQFVEGKFQKIIDTEVWIFGQNKILRPSPTVGVFFDIANAQNFDDWWALKRVSDGVLSKQVAPARRELMHYCHLTNELTYQVVPVSFRDNSFVEVGGDRAPYYSGFSWFTADSDDNLKLAIQAKKSKNPDAAISLVGLMAHLSKVKYSAYWSIGNGTSLWEQKQQLDQLNCLHSQCDGWWEWHNNELTFWETEQWLQWLNKN